MGNSDEYSIPHAIPEEIEGFDQMFERVMDYVRHEGTLKDVLLEVNYFLSSTASDTAALHRIGHLPGRGVSRSLAGSKVFKKYIAESVKAKPVSVKGPGLQRLGKAPFGEGAKDKSMSLPPAEYWGLLEKFGCMTDDPWNPGKKCPAGVWPRTGPKAVKESLDFQIKRKSANPCTVIHDYEHLEKFIELELNAMLKSIPKTIAPKEQRLRQSLTNQYIAPRGRGYYDAFAVIPEASVLSSAEGPVTTVQGIGRSLVAGISNVVLSLPTNGGEVTKTISTNSRMILFNPGASDGTIAWVLTPTSNGTVSKDPILASQLSVTDGFGPTSVNAFYDLDHVGNPSALSESGSPAMRTESIPLRGSLRIRNITENYSVGGLVRVLRYNGGLILPDGANDAAVGDSSWDPTSPVTAQTYVTLAHMVRNAVRTRHYSGKELQESHQVNTYPADFIRSHQFEQDTSFGEAMCYPKYSIAIILIDDFSSGSGTNNSYEINMCVQRAARFAPGSLLHSKAITLRAAPDVLNRHTHAESEGEPLQKIRDALTKFGLGHRR